MVLPIIPILASAGIATGAFVLEWYRRLPKPDREMWDQRVWEWIKENLNSDAEDVSKTDAEHALRETLPKTVH